MMHASVFTHLDLNPLTVISKYLPHVYHDVKVQKQHLAYCNGRVYLLWVYGLFYKCISWLCSKTGHAQPFWLFEVTPSKQYKEVYYPHPLPTMCCEVVQRHLEMAQPTKKQYNCATIKCVNHTVLRFDLMASRTWILSQYHGSRPTTVSVCTFCKYKHLLRQIKKYWYQA